MKAKKDKGHSIFRRIVKKVSQKGVTGNPKKKPNFKAKDANEPVAQGWMWKKSHGLIRSAVPWKKRWFVLYEDGNLVWSNFPKAKSNNSLQLCEEYEIKPLMGSTKDPFCFMIWETKTEKRVMKLATVKESEHSTWLTKLGAACSGGGSSSAHARSLLRKSSSKIELTTELQLVSERASFKGFLLKKPLGRTEGKWHRRYFILDGIRLLYFKVSDDDRIDDTKAGMIVLSPCCKVQTFNSEDDTKHSFKFVTKSCTLYAAAFNDSEMKLWMDHAQKATRVLKEEIENQEGTIKRGILHMPKVHGVGAHGAWTQRFVVVQGGALTMYKDDTETILKDSFDLTSCAAIAHDTTSVRPKGAPPGGAFFSLENPAWADLSRHVRAPTLALMHQWVNTIKKAVDRRRNLSSEELHSRSMSLQGNHMHRSFRLSLGRASGERSMARIQQLLNSFCSPTTPDKAMTMGGLTPLPEDEVSHDDDTAVASKRARSRVKDALGNKLTVRILAYGHNPSKEDESDASARLFNASTCRDKSISDNCLRVYLSVAFREQRWITSHTLQDASDFIEEASIICRALTLMDGSKVSSHERSWSRRKSAYVSLEAQKTSMKSLRDTLDVIMESASPSATHLLLYFLNLLPAPIMPCKTAFSSLSMRALGEDESSTAEDVVTVVKDVGNIMLHDDGADEHLRDARDALRVLLITSDDARPSSIEFKVWDAVGNCADEDASAASKTPAEGESEISSRWWLVRCDESKLANLGSAIASIGLPIPRFPESKNDAEDISIGERRERLKKIFGRGDLAARLIKMFFDEMPVRLLDSIEKQVLALATMVDSPPDEVDPACRECVAALCEPNRSLFLWLLDLMCDVAANEAETKMGHYGLSVVFAPNLVNLHSKLGDEGSDAMAAQMAFNVAVKSLEVLSMWRCRSRAKSGSASASSKKDTDSDHDDDAADDALTKTSVDSDQFGLPLGLVSRERVPRYDAPIPSLLVRLREILVRVGAFHKLGIFRVSPKNEDVGIVRDLIASGDLFGGVLTHQRRLQQYASSIARRYYGLDCVLDFFDVKKDTERRKRLKRLYWLSAACNVRAVGNITKQMLQSFHAWEMSYNKSAPKDLQDMTNELAHIVAVVIRDVGASDDLASKLHELVSKLWSLMRTLFAGLHRSDAEKSVQQLALYELAQNEITGKVPLIPGYDVETLQIAYKTAKRAYYAKKDDESLKSRAIQAKKVVQHAENVRRAIDSSGDLKLYELYAMLKLLVLLRLLRRQMIAAQETKSARDASMRKRDDELRQKKRQPTHVELTQFFMSYMVLGSSPWSWITDRIAIGVMPIKTKLEHGAKLLQESAERCEDDKSLSLIVAVATEEELAGLHSAVDPVSRMEWEENGVEHVRVDLDEEKSRNTPNVSKSKKRAAASWAAQLSMVARKIHKCISHGSCVYIHDTFEETGESWVVVMSYLITFGKMRFADARRRIQQKRSRLKPTTQQIQRVQAFSAYFETSRALVKTPSMS